MFLRYQKMDQAVSKIQNVLDRIIATKITESVSNW